MENSDLESKIIDLQARLQRENEASERDPIPTPSEIGGGLGSPRPGSGRRPKICKYCCNLRFHFYINLKLSVKS